MKIRILSQINIKVNTIKYVTLFLALTFISLNASSQVYTGGNASVNYDRGYYVDLAPLLGYRMGIVNVGVSPFYAYADRENHEPVYSFGARLFTQLTFYKDIYAHVELQGENVQIGKTKNRKWVLSLPVGFGYRYEIAPNTTAYGMILYDVLLNEDSPSRNPIIRGGVTYSF